MTTVLCGIAGSAFAHDNFKTQLDGLNSAWECQDHFDRGTDIAGSIDEFEFCVWYLNSDSKGFIRNDMYYDILPTGDIIAVKKNVLSSDNSAKQAIKAAVEAIVQQRIQDAIDTVIAETDKVAKDLRKQITDLTLDLSDAVMADELKIEVIKDLRDELKEAVENAETLEDNLSAANIKVSDLEDMIDDLEAAATTTATAHAMELGAKTAQIAGIQGIIDGLVDQRDAGLKDLPLQDAINALVADRDALLAEVDSIKSTLTGYGISYDSAAIDAVYEEGRRVGRSEAAFSLDVHVLFSRDELISDDNFHGPFHVSAGTEWISIQLEDVISAKAKEAMDSMIVPDVPEDGAGGTNDKRSDNTYFNNNYKSKDSGAVHWEIPTYNRDFVVFTLDGESAGHLEISELINDMTTQADIDAFVEDAQNAARTAWSNGYREGYDDGYEDGFKDGYQVGYTDGVKSVSE